MFRVPCCHEILNNFTVPQTTFPCGRSERDELDEMSPKKLLWSVLCGTISGVIAAWLVFKIFESKGSAGSGRVGEEIREGADEWDDQNNLQNKLPEENDERPGMRGVLRVKSSHSITLPEMEEFWCNPLFGTFLSVIVTILFLKLCKSKERVAEIGRRRLSGCNDPPKKHPVENDERPAKTPQEHEEGF